MIYPFDLRMILQKVNDFKRIFDMALDAEGERFKSLKKQERVERRYCRTLISHERGAKLEYVREISAGFGENNAVV